MSERCIVAARFTPAGSPAAVGKTVGGFLRYVQHRDLHSNQPEPKVTGLVKYMAYRDQASARAELFGPSGPASSAERKAFGAFVVRSLSESRPQLYRNHQGETADRRRAVYRLVISPERAAGLDLKALTRAAVASLELQLEEGARLRWMAAIHRNTAHPHIHLVVAGMRDTETGFSRIDLTKPRLAAMKAAVGSEIERQRGERLPAPARAMAPARRSAAPIPSAQAHGRPSNLGSPRVVAVHVRYPAAIIRLRAAVQRYRRQIEQDAAVEARRRGWELAA